MDPATQIATQAAGRSFEYGILGVVAVVFALAIFFLWRETSRERREYQEQIRALGEARVREQQAMAERMIGVVERSVAVLTSTAARLEQHGETMAELQSSFRELADELRGLVEQGRRSR